LTGKLGGLASSHGSDDFLVESAAATEECCDGDRARYLKLDKLLGAHANAIRQLATVELERLS